MPDPTTSPITVIAFPHTLPAQMDPHQLINGKFSEFDIEGTKKFFEQHPNQTIIAAKTAKENFLICKFNDGDKTAYVALATQLGEGGFGGVYLAQDIETGKWSAVKIFDIQRRLKEKLKDSKALTQLLKEKRDPAFEKTRDEYKTKKENLRQQFISELQNESDLIRLTAKDSSQSTLLSLLRKEPKTPEKAPSVYGGGMMMELELGVSLDHVTQSASLTSIPILMKRALNTVIAVHDLHEKGVLHRDIKPENFILNPHNNTVHLIDLGLGEKTDPSSLKKTALLSGTRPYIAPELFQQARADKNKQCEFNEASEVYALGNTLCDLFGLPHPHPYDDKTGNIVDNRKSIILPPGVKGETLSIAYAYIQRMTARDPTLRPPLSEAIQFFGTLQNTLLAKIDENTKKTALIDINDYAKASEREKKLLIALTYYGQFDEVLFVDTQKTLTPDQRELIRYDFECARIPVGETILSGQSTQDVLQHCHTYDNDQRIRLYHCITSDAQLEEKIKNPQVCFLNTSMGTGDVNEKLSAHYYNPELRLREPQYNKVVETLTAEVTRLQARLLKVSNKEEKQILNDRILAIDTTKTSLVDDFKQRKLTYATLKTALKSLEEKMIGTGLLQKIANKFNLGATSTSQSNIKKLRMETTSRFHP